MDDLPGLRFIFFERDVAGGEFRCGVNDFLFLAAPVF
jgi:hypothetical protein